MHYISQLPEGASLTPEDTVSFQIEGHDFEFKIGPNFMIPVGRWSADTFFQKMILAFNYGRSKLDLCSELYRYRAGSGNWPTYRNSDYEALTRLVNGIYAICGVTPVHGRVSWDQIVSKCFIETLLKVKTQAGSFSADALISAGTEGFKCLTLPDLNNILQVLVAHKVLVQTEDQFTVDRTKMPMLLHLIALKTGEKVSIVPLTLSESTVLKYIMDSPTSVPAENLKELFGAEGVKIARRLHQREVLKKWERGYYTNSANRVLIDQILNGACV